MTACAICKALRDGGREFTIYTGDLRDTQYLRGPQAFSVGTVKSYANFQPHRFHVCPVCLHRWGPQGRWMKPIGLTGIALAMSLGGFALAMDREPTGLVAFLALLAVGILTVVILVRAPVVERLKRKARKFGQLALGEQEYQQRTASDAGPIPG